MADVGSDHNLVIMNFRVRLKKFNKPRKIRLKFNLINLEKVKEENRGVIIIITISIFQLNKVD